MTRLEIDLKKEKTPIVYDSRFPNPDKYEFSYVLVDTSTSPQSLAGIFNENSPKNYAFPRQYVRVPAFLAKQFLSFVPENI